MLTVVLISSVLMIILLFFDKFKKLDIKNKIVIYMGSIVVGIISFAAYENYLLYKYKYQE